MVRIRFITSEWKVPMSCTGRIFISGHEEHAETAGKELDRELDLGLWASPVCMGKIIQGRQLFRMSLRDKKETVSVNLCGHLYFAQVPLDENCTTYATFFFPKQIQRGESCVDFECLRFIPLQDANLVSQDASGKFPTDLVNCSFIIHIFDCILKQLSRKSSITWNTIYIKTCTEMSYFWRLWIGDRLEVAQI